MENLKSHIEKSIANAMIEKSKLNPETFEVPGFTSPKIRHLLNNLGEFPDLKYLEVGVHKGATFVASNYKNKMKSSTAVDNWSEFCQDGESKREFIKYTEKLLIPQSYNFIEKDCFELKQIDIPNKINFYLYDGCHTYEAQYKSLSYFYEFLDDTFIFLVDDWNWADSQNATRKAIEDLGLKTIFKQELNEGWWNGLLVSLLKK